MLKWLGNHFIYCHMVQKAVNFISNVLEYKLKEIQSATIASFMESNVDSLTKNDRWKDIKYVYKHLVENDKPMKNSMLKAIPTTTRIILNNK